MRLRDVLTIAIVAFVVVSPAGAQDRRRPEPAPPVGDQIAEACRALSEILHFGRIAQNSPDTARSQAWIDAERQVFRFRRYAPNVRELPPALQTIWSCHCPILKIRQKIEEWWRLRELDAMPTLGTDDRSRANRRVALDTTMQHVRAEMRAAERCFKKACGLPVQTGDDAPCPPSTMTVPFSGPILRPPQLGELTPATLRSELEILRQELDQFWRTQFTQRRRPLYSSPGTLAPCASGSCYYAPRSAGNTGGAILFNPADLLPAVKRYGRAILVFSMAHEFGHNAQTNLRMTYEDPGSELLADRLAGAYVGYLHRQGIVISDRPFGTAALARSRTPCPEDDLRALRGYIESIGDPVPGTVDHAWLYHALGAPILHGAAADRWRAFYEGYQRGIPESVFVTPPTNVR